MLQAHAAASSPSPLPRFKFGGPAPEVESVWIEPMQFEPPPIFVTQPLPAWLRQPMPPRPYELAVWIAGHWTWQRRWLWAYGLWTATPGDLWRWRSAAYRCEADGLWFTPAHWAPIQCGDTTSCTDDIGDFDAAGSVVTGVSRARPGAPWAPLPQSELSLRYAPPRAA